MTGPGVIIHFDPAQHANLTPYIAAIQASCITHDRTIASFLPPLSHEKLLAWWKERISEVSDGSRLIFLLASDGAGSSRPKGTDIMGVVMLQMPSSETIPFRGIVESLLVHKSFRGRGAARQLMTALEEEAVNRGRTLLVGYPATRVIGVLATDGK